MCGRVARRPGSGCRAGSRSRRWSCCCRAVTHRSGTPLGRELLDRYTADGRMMRAVSGFDATFSAPKSLSVWWALTGDTGSSKRTTSPSRRRWSISSGSGRRPASAANGGRLHPDTNGLTMATFRQTTSRADDPQIHTHAVISAKVQTRRRPLAGARRPLLEAASADARRPVPVGAAGRAHRTGSGSSGDRSSTGRPRSPASPTSCSRVFSKRSGDIDVALADKVDEFRHREGREPSRWERAALTREASADTRSRKSGHGAADLTTRWQTEAADAGWTVDRLDASIDEAARHAAPAERDHRPRRDRGRVAAALLVGASRMCSQAICDCTVRCRSIRDAAGPDASNEPPTACSGPRRPRPARRHDAAGSDGRSVWIEPTAPRFTSEPVLAQEERSSRGRWPPKPTRRPRRRP